MSAAAVQTPVPLSGSALQSQTLPPLREELNLFAGAPSMDGAPTWILQDPVAHRFYRIGWQEYEILLRWNMRAGDMLREIAQQTTLNVSESDVEKLLKFLATHNLIQSRGPMALQRLQEHAAKLNRRDLVWVVKNYLFIRIPLVRPDKFLEHTLPLIRWLGTRAFFLVTLIAAITGIWLAQRNWDGFLSQFPYFFSLQGVVTMFVTLTFAKILHELGHAYTCKHFGCKVPSMGVALLVLWPVLYTDASDSWRLTSRRQRFIIGAAGMSTELTIAVYATLLWNFLPDGPLRSSVFLLATTTWIVTLLINLNPFMRFDGYYLLSDSLGIPNLQDRAFAIARWRLREALFGFNEPIPERFQPRTYRILLIYSYGTWIYRFFLFIGIALLVYFLFFKILGIALMIIELAWFIGKPVANELKAWHERKDKMEINLQTLRTAGLSFALVLLLVIPWQSDSVAPALWRAEEHASLYSPMAATITTINVQPGSRVQQGDVLFELHSPQLSFEIAQGETILEMLRWQTEFQGFNLELLERAPVIWQQLQAETASQHARLEQASQLQITSPINGVVRELQQGLSVGMWLPENEKLGAVLSPNASVVEAWLNESDLSRIDTAARGRFYPEDPTRPPFDIQVTSIDTASSRSLSEPYLASVHGGPIAVRIDQDDLLIPENPVYRVRAIPEFTEAAPEHILRGTIRIEGDRQSIIGRVWRSVLAILIRESGF